MNNTPLKSFLSSCAQDWERKHKAVVSIYRSHLLAAVQVRPIITQPYIYRNVSCYTYLCDCLWLNRARWMKMFRRFCFKSSVWHTKVKISNWQQYKEFKLLLYVPLNRSVSPLCTANKRHWNCEWEDIVLEHDRDDYFPVCDDLWGTAQILLYHISINWEMLLTCLSL